MKGLRRAGERLAAIAIADAGHLDQSRCARKRVYYAEDREQVTSDPNLSVETLLLQVPRSPYKSLKSVSNFHLNGLPIIQI